MQDTLSRSGTIGRLLVCSMMWSTGFLFMKLAGGVSPWVVSASRASVAAIAIATWFVLTGRDPRPERRERVPWLMLGTLNGWMPNVMTAYALTQITAALSSMIQASGPIMVAVLAHFAFADERLTLRRVAGVLMGFVGMGVLIGPDVVLAGGGAAIGILAMLAVSFLYALGNIYARRIRDIAPPRLALGQQTVSALASLVLSAVLVGTPAAGMVAERWPALLALGLLSTAIPITVFMTLIRGAGATRAAMIGYLLPVWATLLGVLFLGESVGLREVAGAAIILGGVWLVTTAPKAA